MENHGLDVIARQLATGRSRRSLLRGLVAGGSALAAGRMSRSLAAPAANVDVCHWDDDTASYEIITISQNGWTNGHSNHALDFLRNDCCVDAECGVDDACTSHSCNQGTCRETPQPVDCEVSEWSEWSTCSSTCGSGTQTRSRTILAAASCGGVACPSDLEESQSCTGGICPESIGITFGATGDSNYCRVYVELNNFTPETSYSGTYDVIAPIEGFSWIPNGLIGPIVTDVDGHAGPVDVFSHRNVDRAIRVNLDGATSGFVTVSC